MPYGPNLGKVVELARPNPAKRADAAHHAVLYKELDVPARHKSSEKDDGGYHQKNQRAVHTR